jgi:hypothetical protein
MVRPFEIRDVNVIQRLAPLAYPLACELVAVDGINPLREAVRAYLSGGRDHAVVLVARSPQHELEAFGLMYVLSPTSGDGDGHDGAAYRRAALILMSPRAQSDAQVEAWMHLAQEFAVEATRRGVHHIVAEAPETGGEAEALHASGFVPLIQQDVLKLAASPGLNAPSQVSGLREQTRDDEPLIRALHLRAAPKMTYQAEVSFDLLRATHGPERGLVLVHDGELVAHVSVRQGRRSYGMRVLFRPEVESMAQPVLSYALARLLPRTRRPVYLTLRHYQSWLLPVLDDLGFVHLSSTLLMMRHTAARVQQPVWTPAMAENAAIQTTTSASIHLESCASPNEDTTNAPPSARDYARTANH